MEDPKKEAAKTPAAAAAAAKKADATTAATTNKKKRANSKQPEGKATKKKKKDSKKKAPAAAEATRSISPVPPAAAAPAPGPEAPSPVPTPAAAPNPAPTTTVATTTTSGNAANLASKPLNEQVLYRLTEGIPRLELKAMVREADDCEKALIQEIQMLEEALKKEMEAAKSGAAAATTTTEAAAKAPPDSAKSSAENKPNETNAKTTEEAAAKNSPQEFDKQVNIVLENPFSPLDRCFTLSALLGRLRDDLALPTTRKPSPAALAANTSKKKKANALPAPTYPQLVAMADHPNYTRVHPDPPTQLLHVWRKIASHRTAMVFRRPVKPEEAPGYAERILFPMDLSLVRKMIVARILTSYAEVHQRIRLISHNCAKYNGRESDYGVVAREFEAVVDEYMMAAVQQPPAQPGAANKASTPKAGKGGGGSGRSSPKNVGGGGSGRSSPKNAAPAQAAPSAASIAAATAAAAAAVNAPAPAAAATTKPPAAPNTK